MRGQSCKDNKPFPPDHRRIQQNQHDATRQCEQCQQTPARSCWKRFFAQQRRQKERHEHQWDILGSHPTHQQTGGDQRTVVLHCQQCQHNPDHHCYIIMSIPGHFKPEQRMPGKEQEQQPPLVRFVVCQQSPESCTTHQQQHHIEQFETDKSKGERGTSQCHNRQTQIQPDRSIGECRTMRR